MLSLDLVHRAADSIQRQIRRTPVEHSNLLSEKFGVPVWFKLENLQVTGSFKYRGALFALSELKSQGLEAISTCSAGNHGRGVAQAAFDLGMTARIYVPSGVDRTKYRAMVALGADVIVSDFAGYDDTERFALEETDRLGMRFLSAYDDELVMAGNGGTVALEVMQQVPEARCFVMPTGGGGHSAGFCFTINEHKPDSAFVLCQHEESPALQKSLEKGEAVTEMPAVQTLASGIEGGLGKKTFDVIKDLNPQVVLVSEEDIVRAIRWMLEQHQYVIEGSSAVAVAALSSDNLSLLDSSTVIFISGRNISLDTIQGVICD